MKHIAVRILPGFFVLCLTLACDRSGVGRSATESLHELARIDYSRPPPDVVRVDYSQKEPVVRNLFRVAYEAFEGNENVAEMNGQLGMLCHAYDELSAAAVFYKRAASLDSKVFRWQFYLGVVLKALGEAEEAAGTFEQAVVLQPDYLPLQTHLGELYIGGGQLDRAERAYHKALETSPDCALAYYGLGRIESRRRNHEGAARHLEKSLSITDSQESHYVLAITYRQLDRLDEAEVHMRLSQQTKTRLVAAPDPLRTEVDRLKQGGRYDLIRGVEMAAAGNEEYAIRYFEAALRDQPGLAPAAHIQIARIKAKRNDWDGALEHYRKALELQPDDGATLNDCGVALTRTNRLDEAIEHFQKALEAGSPGMKTHANLGRTYLALGRLEESVKHYGLAVEAGPKFLPVRRGLATALSRAGEFERAIATWSSYLDKAPNDSAAWLEYASVLERVGRSEDADLARQRGSRPASQGAGAHSRTGKTAER